jgi:5-methylthioadenosine/S-adenosylhomocysteine deaminase
LQKVTNKKAAEFAAENALWMATAGSAKAMGLCDCDSIAVGKKADMIVIDLATPNMQPIHHIPNNIVYCGSKQNVKMTMINGKILYMDGKFYIDEPAEDVYARANKMLDELK